MEMKLVNITCSGCFQLRLQTTLHIRVAIVADSVIWPERADRFGSEMARVLRLLGNGLQLLNDSLLVMLYGSFGFAASSESPFCKQKLTF